ncbi:tape measure protein [Cellulosimicrobium sp. 72-3]|uniref:tape measure protein n=1 Tax=Cellulosimicrobium sp. 72-3 TaxID=2731680 RepID=UPI00148EE8AE|nr:tape measure protein [Cellulosimicrobium sp. 72-3]
MKLRAEVDQYKRSMDDAAKATEKVGTSAEGTSKKADGALSRMMQSAQQNREAWSTVGTTLVAAGGAVTAFGVAALKTGIEYNTLQQTSRAALTSLLGSARAANEQMDKLDAFAKTSPFSKATFIQAQQQMLAFGIETQKVIPYLDAVQNAVAAAGGSNQDIAEIVATMSKIQSSAKITAEDLNEFGGRGVDAATLIGEQMGYTGAQIRESITNGSLGAEEALDALAAGMSQKFAGAADNVKNTFAGATDRVKAAWRDFAAELATPLVDPQGGGALVDFLNGVADAMRNFSKLPEPVKGAITAMSGIAGVSALAAGGLLLLVPRVADTVEGFQKFAPAGSRARDVLSGLGKAAGVATAIYAVAASTGALVDAFTRGEQAVGNNSLQKAIRETVDAGKGLSGLDVALSNTGTFLGMARVEAGSLTEAFDQMLNPSVTDRISGFFDGIPGVTGYMEKLEERVSGVDAALSAMADAGDADTVQALMDMFREAGYSAEDLATLLPQTTDALVGVTAETEKTAASTSTLAGWQQRLAEQMASMDPAAKANADAFAALVDSTSNAGSAFLGAAARICDISDRLLAEQAGRMLLCPGPIPVSFVRTSCGSPGTVVPV